MKSLVAKFNTWISKRLKHNEEHIFLAGCFAAVVMSAVFYMATIVASTLSGFSWYDWNHSGLLLEIVPAVVFILEMIGSCYISSLLFDDRYYGGDDEDNTDSIGPTDWDKFSREVSKWHKSHARKKPHHSTNTL